MKTLIPNKEHRGNVNTPPITPKPNINPSGQKPSRKIKLSQFPPSVKILDTTYKILYVNNPCDVDVHQREAYWGQIDYWTSTIRVYVKDRTKEDIWQTIWHEVMHGICEKFKMDKALNEDQIDMIATGINNVMLDNKF